MNADGGRSVKPRALLRSTPRLWRRDDGAEIGKEVLSPDRVVGVVSMGGRSIVGVFRVTGYPVARVYLVSDMRFCDGFANADEGVSMEQVVLDWRWAQCGSGSLLHLVFTGFNSASGSGFWD